jgi:hypothetical protein
LNDVPSFSVGGAFLELHCFVADDAPNEIDQWAFIVVARRAHFSFAVNPASGAIRSAFRRLWFSSERRSGLAIRYRLPRRQRVKGPSIGLVRDLLLRRSFLFAHRFAFSPSSTSRRMASERVVSFAVAHASTSAIRPDGILEVT